MSTVLDLADPAFYAGDPHPLFTDLRSEERLTWCPTPGFWAVARHRDILEVSTDAERFCSGRGVLLQDIGVDLPDIPGALLYIDPPDHTRYRRLIQPAFGPKRMRAATAQIASRVDALVDVLPPGEVDIVPVLSVPFPIQVIADLLGIDDTRWSEFYAWSDAFIAAADGGSNQSPEIAELTTAAVLFLLDEVASRRTAPRDDLVTDLVQVEIDGDALLDDELMMFLIQLLVAGNETTRNLISGGLAELSHHPDQWSALRNDRGLIPGAIEEMLRWTSPVTSFLRTATVDTEVSRTTVKAGQPLLLLYASGNRDEHEFGPTADAFDITRTPNHHLAFGFGAHFCLGASLARIEMATLLDRLLTKVATIEPAGEPVRKPSTVIAGFQSVPLRLA